jgi:hypothetical protein
MIDNRLPLTAEETARNLRYYIETKFGIRSSLFLERHAHDIGDTIAKLIDLRIESGMTQPDWGDEEWSAMSEHAELMYKFGYSLIQLIDSYIEEVQQIRAA